jgi:hypothetical protein
MPRFGKRAAGGGDGSGGRGPDGSTPDGSTPDGSTPDGSEPDGSEPRGSEPGGSGPVSFLGAIREAVAGGTTFSSRDTVPAGRAERLGLSVIDPAASTTRALPLEFLRIGDTQRIGAELGGQIGGLGARIFEFTAGEAVGSRSDSAGGWNDWGFHVAALELGFGLPRLAIVPRPMRSPLREHYAGHRGQHLETPDHRVNREHLLLAAEPRAASAVLAGPVGDVLAHGLALRIDSRPIGYLEVSQGWALAAIPARGLALPDAVALNQQARLGRPGPWPDALLGLLGEFRAAVPPGCRQADW